MISENPVPTRWWRWLWLAGLWLVLDALTVLFLPHTHAELFFRLLFDLNDFDTLPEHVQDFSALFMVVLAAMQGVIGALVAGIAHGAFRQGERWAWVVIVLATLPWIVAALTMAGIIMSGQNFWMLVLGGGYYALLLWPPLIFSRRHFSRKQRAVEAGNDGL
jgi:hypothetical protein